jgi:putative heme-binding domain-containing protein
LEQLFPDVNSPARKLLASQIDAATRDALDPELAIDQRAEAIDTLRHARFDQAAPLARRLLAYDQPDRLRRAAINMLAAMTESNVADVLLEYWPQYGPALQEEAARLVLSRPAWIERMLALVETDAVPADSLGAALRSRLVNHNNRQIAEKARQLLGEATSDRAGVIEQYRSALSLPGDANLGAAIYERECSACHRLGDRGNELGPNLMLTRNRSPEALLIHILDPNREVPPKYVQYVAIDTSGRTINGIMTAETATSITLARERGVAETLLKSNIDDLSSTGRSVMPEGFERTITPHDMAHLLAFLLDVQYDVGTIPGEDIPGQEGALIGKE